MVLANTINVANKGTEEGMQDSIVLLLHLCLILMTVLRTLEPNKLSISAVHVRNTCGVGLLCKAQVV